MLMFVCHFYNGFFFSRHNKDKMGNTQDTSGKEKDEEKEDGGACQIKGIVIMLIHTVT